MKYVISISLFFFIIIISSISSLLSYKYLFFKYRDEKIITNSSKLVSNTSIAFYTIAGYNQKIEPDLRGNFWEFQLKNYEGKYKNIRTRFNRFCR